MQFPIYQPAPKISIDQIHKMIDDLSNNPNLGGNRKVVHPTGDGSSGVMVFGENPGDKDVIIGEPFVGPYSELFNSKLLPSAQLTRQNIYLTNLVKFSLPANRDPEENEIEACEPILVAEIALNRPKLVVAMGKFAAQFLLNEKVKITKIHGKFYKIQIYDDLEITVLVTMHPAAAYHNDRYLPDIKSDFELIQDFFDGKITKFETPKPKTVEEDFNQNLF